MPVVLQEGGVADAFLGGGFQRHDHQQGLGSGELYRRAFVLRALGFLACHIEKTNVRLNNYIRNHAVEVVANKFDIPVEDLMKIISPFSRTSKINQKQISLFQLSTITLNTFEETKMVMV